MSFRHVTGSVTSVAPHWGAWIEISPKRPHGLRTRKSHPTGVRGLKFGDAADGHACQLSHPTGVRGLKSDQGDDGRASHGSHPTGVRGLKYEGQACDGERRGRTPLGCVD